MHHQCGHHVEANNSNDLTQYSHFCVYEVAGLEKLKVCHFHSLKLFHFNIQSRSCQEKRGVKHNTYLWLVK